MEVYENSNAFRYLLVAHGQIVDELDMNKKYVSNNINKFNLLPQTTIFMKNKEGELAYDAPIVECSNYKNHIFLEENIIRGPFVKRNLVLTTGPAMGISICKAPKLDNQSQAREVAFGLIQPKYLTLTNISGKFFSIKEGFKYDLFYMYCYILKHYLLYIVKFIHLDYHYFWKEDIKKIIEDTDCVDFYNSKNIMNYLGIYLKDYPLNIVLISCQGKRFSFKCDICDLHLPQEIGTYHSKMHHEVYTGPKVVNTVNLLDTILKQVKNNGRIIPTNKMKAPDVRNYIREYITLSNDLGYSLRVPSASKINMVPNDYFDKNEKLEVLVRGALSKKLKRFKQSRIILTNHCVILKKKETLSAPKKTIKYLGKKMKASHQ